MQVAGWQILDAATTQRKRLLRAGYLPIPAAGKKPPIAGWQNLVANEGDIDGWFHQYPEAFNTGVLTRATPAVDIDVYDPDVADTIEALLWEMIGTRGMIRIGEPPKRAALFRTNTPFAKLSTPAFISPTRQRHRVEILGDGQQIVVLGTHPGTGNAYSWQGGQPGDVARAELPELTEAVAREFVTKAAEIMRAQQGWTEEVRKTNGVQHGVGDSSDEFDSIYGNRQRKYALAALQGCTAELSAMAPDSGRNDKLNAVAFRLGTMCARGWISRDEVESRLFAAAVACRLVADDGEAATRATLASGLGGGELKPHPDLTDETASAPSSNPAPTVDLFWHGEPDTRPAHSWLAEKLIPGKGIGLMSGQWGACKTFAAFDLSASIASGMPFAGREIVRPGGVLFVAAEGGDEVRTRLKGVEHKLRAAAFVASAAGNPIEADLNHLPLVWIEEPVRFNTKAGFEQLLAIAGTVHNQMLEKFGVPLVCIIIDTMMASVDFQDANSAAETQQVMNGLRGLSQKTGAFVLVVDHFGKNIEVGTKGSSNKEDASDLVLAMLADRDVGGSISNTRMKVRKLRNGKSGVEFPFNLAEVDLGDGETTCTIDWKPERDDSTKRTSGKESWTKTLRIFRSAMETVVIDHGRDMFPYGSDGPKVRGVKLEQVRAEFVASYPADNEDRRARDAVKRSAFSRAMKDARERLLISSREVEGVDHLWLVDETELDYLKRTGA
jgi:AAA domain/Bifunctional DNA primase/polymerase, N-terminal